MSSSWEPAIAQAMQRHGGSNRSIPRIVQPKPSLKEALNEPAVPGVPEVSAPSVTPERPTE